MISMRMDRSMLLLTRAVRFVKRRAPRSFRPQTALVLGSGLAGIVRKMEVFRTIPYHRIPGMGSPGVQGHPGQLVLGRVSGKDTLVFSGRTHYYEGFPMSKVIIPVRMAALLGVRAVVLTSAVGTLNKKIHPLGLVVVKDHINFMGSNPLRGWHHSRFGERFPELCDCYTPRLLKLALRTASKLKIPIHPGVYFAAGGPSYETPAEIRAFRKLGGDVIGMSMVPETIAAKQMGLEVLGLCAVSNYAAGISKVPLNHRDVLEAGKKTGEKLSRLLKELFKDI